MRATNTSNISHARITCWLCYSINYQTEKYERLIATLNAHQPKFNRLGFGKSVTRRNLSKANEICELKIFEDMANLMISMARDKRSGEKDFFLDGNVYAFDSSAISLCLRLFWWTKSHHNKGGVKLHTLF